MCAVNGDRDFQRFEAAEPLQIVNPVDAEPRCEQLSEARIGKDHPAPGGDAVGLVGEFLRRELVEVAQHMGLEQLGMQRGHAVDGMAAECGQMRHAHVFFAVFVDER